MISSMASPEDDPSKLPTRQELLAELGLRMKNEDETVFNSFTSARTKFYNNFLDDTGISEKRLSEWSTKECQDTLRKLAQQFLNREGYRFWPEKPTSANKKGYTYQKDKATLTSLLIKYFFQFINGNRRRVKRRKTQKQLIARNGNSVENPITIEDLSDDCCPVDEPEETSDYAPKREPYPEDSPTLDNFPERLPSLPAEAPPQGYFSFQNGQPVTRASKRPAEAELEEDQNRAKNPRYFDAFVPPSDDDTVDSAFSDVSDRVFREFNNRENRSKRKDRIPEDEELDPSSTDANVRSSTVDSGVFVGGVAREDDPENARKKVKEAVPHESATERRSSVLDETTISVRPTNAAPLSHGCSEPGENIMVPQAHMSYLGEVENESKLDATTHFAGPSHEFSTAPEQIPVDLTDDIDGISDSWALGDDLTAQKGLDDIRGPCFPKEKCENPYQALLEIPSKKQPYFDCEHAKSVLDNHLRSHATHTDTPIKFAFAVRHCTGHADRFTFSPYSFFSMSLQEFVEALPMEDKEKITGLCIRQYSGTVTHLRQVYLYNEEVFGNIREECMRHIEHDIRNAKGMGKRLDYEISIEPLTDDDC
ncbi:uncharacterized protein B0J16DRAFT_377657 [Fusarium flagelliforme]|uniref:Uncharacterized protein n=1 Tax=Fusarium flagelliforme TaxID=2675880 RepID=A0A395MTR0_9HYPO|nr:uncharacterized protein B0J16DRAFT_377657 [Fusarium flagelliforme]KAH7197205.1 hypothetical protein B0J16DRAFT_377657 [Fusarium flagelliforme]RFN51150.1 hypothetical protein FIE12Z_4603 [Fusarium flagelliforme]